MVVLNASVTEVLKKLWELSETNGGYYKLNNNDDFIPLTIEIVGEKMLSICHYGESDGDLMRDPEMVFIRQTEGFYAVYFRNDWVGKEEYSGWIYNGKVICRNEQLQKQHTVFANEWLMNIREQQEI